MEFLNVIISYLVQKILKIVFELEQYIDVHQVTQERACYVLSYYVIKLPILFSYQWQLLSILRSHLVHYMYTLTAIIHTLSFGLKS